MRRVQEGDWLGMAPGIWPDPDYCTMPKCSWGTMVRLHGAKGLVSPFAQSPHLPNFKGSRRGLSEMS